MNDLDFGVDYGDLPIFPDWSKTESVKITDFDSIEIQKLFPFVGMLRKEYGNESDNVADIIREFFFKHNLRVSYVSFVSGDSSKPYIKIPDVENNKIKSVNYTRYTVIIGKDCVIDLLNQKYIRKTPNYFREIGKLNRDRKLRLDKTLSYVYDENGTPIIPKGIKWLFSNEYN